MDEDISCDIYLESEKTAHDLAVAVAKGVKGVVHAKLSTYSIENEIAILSLEKNPYAKGTGMVSGKDCFLRYPFRLEIDPKTGADRHNYVGLLAGLLIHLWDGGIAAVASCDFEHELPKNGGIDRLTDGNE